jgi:X-Pro dipeptidyl-peptidase (S15 family)
MRGILSRYLLAACAALALAMAFAPASQAAYPANVFGGALTCTSDAGHANVRVCAGKVPTWDGATKIDVNVFLPPAPASGPDGPYPLIGIFHGWGGHKLGFADDSRIQQWAQGGYAVFSQSDRGWGNSCGAMDPDYISHNADCTQGYNHLMDDRYEVRDAQYLMSVLADDGAVIPNKIGVTGPSYGGGLSMALAALKDRYMKPDGSLAAWVSPNGTPMQIAVAAPEIPWTDLAYSLMPNGRTLDYVADAPYRGPNSNAPIGVEKQSFVSGLYGTGLVSSNYSATDSQADLNGWYTVISAGEPYDSNPLAGQIVDEITSHHSSYYINHSEPPAPLLISNGWTDDLFPPDEAIRFYNRTRTQYPGNPISLFFLDYGHQRGQNKAADIAVLHARQNAWFAYYLKGVGSPPTGVEALTKTCPSGAASGGPFFADNWRDIAPGEIRLDSAAPQTVAATVPSDGSVASSFDPIAGGGACATASGTDQTGAATYRLPTAPTGGYTLMGSPTIVADIAAASPTSQLAARLEDVDPVSGNETLVARALYRPGTGTQVFQLHPDGWKFEAGHIAKLELLPSDTPYGRVSNGQATVTISNLELRLPVLESPGTGLAQQPAPKIVPPGYQLAPDYTASGGGSSSGQPGATPGPSGTTLKCAKRHGHKHKHRGHKRCKHKKHHRR